MDLASLGIRVRTDGVQEATRDLGRLTQQGQRTERSAGTLGTAMKRLGPVMASVFSAYSVTQMTKIADEFSNMNSRLLLVAKSAMEAEKAQGALFALSQKTGSELGATTDLFTKLAQSSDELRNNHEQLLRVVELVNKSMTISGASAAEAAGAQRQLAQALAAGVLRGDEFNSVMENAPRLARAIADGLDVPIGRLRKMAEEGELTSERVTSALLKSGQKIDAEFDRMPLTVGRAMQKVENSFDQLIGKTDQAAGASGGLADAIDNVADAMGDPQTIAAFQSTASWLANIAAGALDAAGAMREFLAENERKGNASLQNRRNELESDNFGLARKRNPRTERWWQATAGVQMRENEAEIAEIDRIIGERERKAFETLSRHSPAVERAGLMFNPRPRDPIGTGGTGTQDRAKAAREQAQATRELTEAEKQYLEVEEDYGIIVAGVEDFRRRAIDLSYQQSTAIEQGQAATASLIDDMRFEQQLLQASAVDREKMIALRYADANATDAQRTEIARLAEETYNLREIEQIKGDFKEFFASSIADFSSAGDAFESLMDRMKRQAAQMLADKAIQYLFSLFAGMGGGASAPSTSFAAGFGNNTSWLFDGSYGGTWGGVGLSEGGYTGPGGKLEPAGIVHKGEVVWSQADVARAGGVGTVESMRLRGYADGGVVGQYAPRPSGGGGIRDIVINAPPGSTARTEERPAGDGSGMKDMVVFIEQTARRAIGKDLATDTGVAKIGMQAYGWRRQGIPRG